MWFAPKEPNLRQQPVEQLGEGFVGDGTLDDLPVYVERGAQTDARILALLVHAGDFVGNRRIDQTALHRPAVQTQLLGQGHEGGIFQIPQFALARKESVVHTPEGERVLLPGAFCGLVGQGGLAVIEDVPEDQLDLTGCHVILHNFWFNTQHVRAAGASEKVRVVNEADGCVGVAAHVQPVHQ